MRVSRSSQPATTSSGDGIGIERKSVLDLHFVASGTGGLVTTPCLPCRRFKGSYLLVEGPILDDGRAQRGRRSGSARCEIGDRGVTVLRSTRRTETRPRWIMRVARPSAARRLAPTAAGARTSHRSSHQSTSLRGITGVGPRRARFACSTASARSGVIAAAPSHDELQQVRGVGPSTADAIASCVDRSS